MPTVRFHLTFIQLDLCEIFKKLKAEFFIGFGSKKISSCIQAQNKHCKRCNEIESPIKNEYLLQSVVATLYCLFRVYVVIFLGLFFLGQDLLLLDLTLCVSVKGF